MTTHTQNRLVALSFESNPFRRLVIYFDNFTYCYRKDCSFFAAFYFFVRVILQSIQTFSKVTPLQQTFKCMICIFVCVVFTFVQPYNDPWMNYFDSFVLANLTVISLISLSMRSFAERNIDILTDIINVLVLLPFLLVAGKFLRIYGAKFWRWIKIKYTAWKNRGRYVSKYFTI